MAVDIAWIGITIDTSGVKAGAGEVRAEVGRMKAEVGGTVRQMAQEVDASARSMLNQQKIASHEMSRQLVATMKRDAEQIKAAIKSGLLTPQQAAIDARLAAEAYKTELEKHLRSMRGSGPLRPDLMGAGVQVARASREIDDMAQSFRIAETASRGLGAAFTGSTPGAIRFQNALQTVSLTAAGVPGPVGNAVRALSFFSLGGGGAAILTVAGIAAITAGVQKLAERSKEAKRPLEELQERIESLQRAGRDPLLQFTNDRVDVENYIRDIEQQVRASRERLAKLSGDASRGSGGLGGVIDAVLEQRNLNKLMESLRGFYADKRSLDAEDERRTANRLTSIQRLEADAALATAKRSGDRAAIARAEATILEATIALRIKELAITDDIEAAKVRAALVAINDAKNQAVTDAAAIAARNQRRQLLVAEQNAVIETARLRGDHARAEEAQAVIRRAEIDHTLQSMEHLSAVERDRLRTALEVVDAAAHENRLYEARLALMKEIRATAAVVSFVSPMGDRVAGRYSAIRESTGIDGLSDTAKALQFEINKIIEAEQRRVDAASATAQAIEDERLRQAEILRAVGHGIADLSEQLFGLSRGAASAVRGLTDIAGGILSKNPTGIISGAVGLVGSIFGDGGRRQRQEAREARASHLDDINSFIDSIAPPKTDIDALVASYKDLHAEGKRLGLGNHELARLTQAYANELARLQEVERTRNAAMQEDLQVRMLMAQGRDREAEALRFALEQQREYAQAIEDGFSAATLEMLASTQALEAQAEAQRAANEAIREAVELARQQADLSADFAERSARLAGNTTGADLIAIDRQFAAEWQRIEDLVRDGILSVGEAAQWQALIEGERQQAIDDVTESIREQQEAMALLVRNTEEDLRVRELRAMGLDAEADALQRTIDGERELQRMRDQGVPESVIAYAKYVQGLEETKRVIQDLERAHKELAEQLKREAEFVEDLQIRRLRATGNADAADEAAMYARHQREIDDATSAGRSPEAIADLIATQLIERQAARDAREQQQREAFNAAAAANAALGVDVFDPSRTSQNLAVGITGSQADRLAGMMSTGVAIASQQLEVQRQMRAELQAIKVLLARTTGMTPEEIAFQVEQVAADAARSLGVNPGNA